MSLICIYICLQSFLSTWSILCIVSSKVMRFRTSEVSSPFKHRVYALLLYRKEFWHFKTKWEHNPKIESSPKFNSLENNSLDRKALKIYLTKYPSQIFYFHYWFWRRLILRSTNISKLGNTYASLALTHYHCLKFFCSLNVDFHKTDVFSFLQCFSPLFIGNVSKRNHNNTI